ncbi:MAG: response regulator [Candidatus Hodarchaeales archaeon]
MGSMFRILAVDDEKELLLVTKMFLTQEEPAFAVTTVTSAQKALQKLTEEHFDAVVSDYQMPNMNGIEFLERLRRKNNTIPFILFTGKRSEDVVIKALNLGAHRCISKQGDIKVIYAKLTYVMKNLLYHKSAKAALRENKKISQTLFEENPEPIPGRG